MHEEKIDRSRWGIPESGTYGSFGGIQSGESSG